LISYHLTLSENSGDIYLKLLDEEGFLIESLFIDNVVAKYTGELLGHFNMKWDVFKKINLTAFSLEVRILGY
jgi:hypothetical protein